jgi:hypothetical protein
VLTGALAADAEWRSQGFLLARMAVNLFPKQLYHRVIAPYEC